MQLIDIYKYHNSLDFKRLFAFKGPFDKNIIASFGELIRKYTNENKKIFKIFIELAQNVAYYSDERKIIGEESIGIGSLAIGSLEEKYRDYYVINVGNKIKCEKINILIKKCEIINSSTHEELRAFKRNERKLLPGTNSNAHIGLIMSALITRDALNIVENKIDDKYSFFTLNLYVNKQDALRNEL